ncbi:MAG: O-antigen ligase family protein [Lachnospiraceae bacterium]
MLSQNLDSDSNSQYTRNLLAGYFLMLLTVMIASNFFVFIDVFVTLWMGNIAALGIFMILLIHYNRFTTREAAAAALAAFAVQIPAIIFYSDHILDSMKSLGQNANIFSLPCYFIITGILANESILEKDMAAILKMIFYTSAIVALITFLTNLNTLYLFATDTNSYQIAFNGIFHNKNNLGVFCCIGLIVGLYLFYIEEKKGLIVFLWGITAVVLVLSLSRAAMVMLLAFVIIFVIKRLGNDDSHNFQNSDKIIRRLFWGLIIVLVTLFILNDSFRDFVMLKIIRMDAGSAGRINIWNGIIDNFDNNIIFYLFGMGFGELNYRSLKDSHNIYLNIFSTGGLIKCFIYIFIFAKSLSVIKRLKQYDRLLSDFCFSVAVSYLIFGIFETLIIFEFGLFSFELALLFIFIPLLRLPRTEPPASAALVRRGGNERR